MTQPLAYINGEFVTRSEARLHVFDLGIVGGIAVAEMLRTFRHRPFRMDEHLVRLEQSLTLTGLVPPIAISELPAIIERVVESESRRPVDEDFGIIVFVTAGLNPTYVGREAAQQGGCSLGVHTFELQSASWAEKYDHGVALVTPPQHALPEELVDPRIKSRSRMHWHLAERAVRKVDPQATALLIDDDGFITETAAANFCAVIDETIVSPLEGTVLEGVSLGMVCDLAAELGVPFERRMITVAEALAAKECFLTSTPSCLLPVATLNGRRIGNDAPGPIYRRLLQAWSSEVGVDIRAQALDSAEARG